MPFLTSQQAAELLGVSRRYINKLCEKGEIRGAYKSGHRWMIPEDALPSKIRSRACRSCISKSTRSSRRWCEEKDLQLSEKLTGHLKWSRNTLPGEKQEGRILATADDRDDCRSGFLLPIRQCSISAMMTMLYFFCLKRGILLYFLSRKQLKK